MKHHTHNSQFHDVTTSQSTITPEKQNTENESTPQQSLTRKERTTHVTQHPNTRHPAASNSNMIDKGGGGHDPAHKTPHTVYGTQPASEPHPAHSVNRRTTNPLPPKNATILQAPQKQNRTQPLLQTHPYRQEHVRRPGTQTTSTKYVTTSGILLRYVLTIKHETPHPSKNPPTCQTNTV